MGYFEHNHAQLETIERAELLLRQGVVSDDVYNFRGILPGGPLRNFIEVTRVPNDTPVDTFLGKTAAVFFDDVDRAIVNSGLDPLQIKEENRRLADPSQHDLIAGLDGRTPHEHRHIELIKKCMPVLRRLITENGYPLEALTS